MSTSISTFLCRPMAEPGAWSSTRMSRIWKPDRCARLTEASYGWSVNPSCYCAKRSRPRQGSELRRDLRMSRPPVGGFIEALAMGFKDTHDNAGDVVDHG